MNHNTFLPENYSLRIVTHYGSLVGFTGHLFFMFLFAWAGVWPMAAINVVSCTIFTTSFWINRRGYPHPAILIGIGEIITHAVLAVAFVGWESGFQYYLIALAPMIFYSPAWSSRTKAILTGLLSIIYVSLYCFTWQAPPWYTLDLWHIHTMSIINSLMLFLVFSSLAYLYHGAITQAEKSLQQANQKLETMAHTDPLTQLYNRRSMINALTQEAQTFAQTGRPFTVILGDLDNFKVYNDRYSHEAGDAVLVMVAEILTANVRRHDQVARWGGEEFLILLPGTGLEEARLIGERLRESIAAASIAFGDYEGHITMTMGVCSCVECLDTVECIHRADLAMYEGKRRGKNCVMVGTDI